MDSANVETMLAWALSSLRCDAMLKLLASSSARVRGGNPMLFWRLTMKEMMGLVFVTHSVRDLLTISAMAATVPVATK